MVVVGTAAAELELTELGPAAGLEEGVETGIGTIVSVIGVTEELETPAAAEELEEETPAAAEVVAPAVEVRPGQLVTSGAQDVMVISSTEV